MEAGALNGLVVLAIMSDHDGNIWIGGNKGIIRRSEDGALHRYGMKEGLPDPGVLATACTCAVAPARANSDAGRESGSPMGL